MNRRFGGLLALVAILVCFLTTLPVFGQTQPLVVVAPVSQATAVDVGLAASGAHEGKKIPDWVTYRFYFVHLEYLDEVADDQEALGNKTEADAWRTHEQRAAGLSEKEAEILKQIAYECNQAVEMHDAKVRAAADQLAEAQPLGDRTQIVNAQIDKLLSQLGDVTFEKLDRYVRATFEPGAKTLAILATPSAHHHIVPSQAADASISVATFTTAEGTQGLAECHTDMDPNTAPYYVGVSANCGVYHFEAGGYYGTFVCPAPNASENPSADCSGTFPLITGHTYRTDADHFLYLYRGDHFGGFVCADLNGDVLYYDPFNYSGNGVEVFDGSGTVYPLGGQGPCAFGPQLQFATTFGLPVTAGSITILPQGPEVFPGQQQQFTASVDPPTLAPVAWSVVDAVGTSYIVGNGLTATFVAPTNDELRSRGLESATITVEACSIAYPSQCGVSKVTVPRIDITVSGTNPFLANAAATQTLRASVAGPVASHPDVTWPTLPSSQGVLVPGAPGSNTATYSAPIPVLPQTSTVSIHVCLKDIPTICTEPDFQLELVAPVKIGAAPGGITSVPPGFPAGHVFPDFVAVTITGSGFGTNPMVTFNDPTIAFTQTSASNTQILGNASIPATSRGPVQLTVTSTTDGITSQDSATITISAATFAVLVNPKTVSLRESESRQFIASVLCRTADLKNCLVLQGVFWSATAGTIDANGLYKAPSSGVIPPTATITACAGVSPTVCTTATVTLTPISVTVSPTSANVVGCQSKSFAATVTNATLATVSWSVSPGGGTIDAQGVYSAPCPVSTSTTATVKACSTVDAGRCAAAIVTLSPNLQLTLLSVAPTTVQGGNSATGTVTLSGPATSGGALITLQSGDRTQATVPSSVVVGAGLLSATFQIATSAVYQGRVPPATISATFGGVTKTAMLTVQVPIPTVGPRPKTIVVPPRQPSGTSFTTQVTMDSAAPAGGVTVSLSSSNPSAASVPPSVNVAAGATLSALFTVTTGIVSSSTNVTITGTYQGYSTSASFYVDPPVYQGYHDTADCYGTTGWAWDANRPNTAINVDIYADGSLIGTVLANGYRADLLAAHIGNGYHGFGYNLPAYLRAGSHTITAKYSGTQTLLGTSPKTITCESAKVIWIQPQTTAGFGPPGSLVLAGSAVRGPAGLGVTMWYQDLTAGTGWTQVGYAAPPDSSGIWYNSIPSANFSHVYQVRIQYDQATGSCAYAGKNAITWCP